jgi:NAD(P)-dependent dehydrogenase (short-subunit alcohol dehydrogenase family)
MQDVIVPENPRARCLVLGGTGYIGEAVVRTLHREGAEVAFTFHTQKEKARLLEQELARAFGMVVELGSFDTSHQVVREATGRLGGLDALIQCAGTGGDPDFYKIPPSGSNHRLFGIKQENLQKMWEVTVQSTLSACQEAVRSMEEKGGNIVIVGSMDGMKPLPGPVHYSTVKGALRSLVESLAKEVGENGICVNQVAPGILEEGMARHVADEFLESYVKHCSLGRVGKSQEVAELVSWLALENTYVTAQSILVDGGL